MNNEKWVLPLFKSLAANELTKTCWGTGIN